MNNFGNRKTPEAKGTHRLTPIIEITHSYCLLDNRYALQTQYSLKELNHLCAYVQLSRYHLPDFSTIKEDLDQAQLVDILHQLYDCERIVINDTTYLEATINLYENWNIYAPSEGGEAEKSWS